MGDDRFGELACAVVGVVDECDVTDGEDVEVTVVVGVDDSGIVEPIEFCVDGDHVGEGAVVVWEPDEAVAVGD